MNGHGTYYTQYFDDKNFSCNISQYRYRGIVEGVPSRSEIQVFYSDFGNVSTFQNICSSHPLQPLLERVAHSIKTM